MKKIVLAAALALGALTATAQPAIIEPGFDANWSVGLEGGGITPMNHAAFFGDMRGVFGMHINKQITPVFGLGVEGFGTVNTSSWWMHQHSSTAIDHSYVGMYGTADLFNLFGGYNCEQRKFTIRTVVGGGWGHEFRSGSTRYGDNPDRNYMAFKAGLSFDYNITPSVTLSLKPFAFWDLNRFRCIHHATRFDKNAGAYSIQAGVTYNFGKGFECQPAGYSQADMDLLNNQINSLRAERDAALAAVGGVEAQVAALNAQNGALAAELADCRDNNGKLLQEMKDQGLCSRYVFFQVSKAVVTPDQMPSIDLIARFMKSHPNTKVQIKGYASKDGPKAYNLKLAQKRAVAVKDVLVKKYKIAADRIVAEGAGIGEMFEKGSWNRVSICTID